MLVTPLESVIFFSLVQPENALSPILVALPRMVMLLRLSHLENAPSPILVTLLGIVMLLRLLQV